MPRLLILLLLSSVAAWASQDRYRRDADWKTWFLTIEGRNYQLSLFSNGTHRTFTKGMVTERDGGLLFKGETDESDIVHGQRFLSRQFRGNLYLVEESRLREFESACENPEASPLLELMSFFVRMPAETATHMRKEVQPPQHNAGSRPSSGYSHASESPSSVGPRG